LLALAVLASARARALLFRIEPSIAMSRPASVLLLPPSAAGSATLDGERLFVGSVSAPPQPSTTTLATMNLLHLITMLGR
jgi:hypothetical protein